MSSLPEYPQYDALGLAQLVRNKEVTASELVEEAIRRIERHNPQLNAVVERMYEIAKSNVQSQRLGDGPFHGVPFLLKDLIAAYQGVPLRSGCRFSKDYVPDHDSALVKRFKASGVNILGKTNTPEYGIAPVTEPELFGPTFNPWDTRRTPGGSSGGSGAAVASGMVPLASANDGGGSIRIPASCCGLFGLKPSRGRVPTGPEGELWRGLTAEHVLTRSVRDSAAMLDAVAGPDLGAPYAAPPPARPFLDEVNDEPGQLRIAYSSKPLMGGHVEDDCVAAMNDAVGLLDELGHQVEEAAPELDAQALGEAFVTLVCAEVHADIKDGERLRGRKAQASEFETHTWMLAHIGQALSAGELSAALRYLQRSARRIAPLFERYDVLVTPTLAKAPVLTGALQPTGLENALMRAVTGLKAGSMMKSGGLMDTLKEKVFDFIPYTPLFNITGQPAMSVPLYWNGIGLPVGTQFIAGLNDEATLFRLAAQLEQARPWFNRLPKAFQ